METILIIIASILATQLLARAVVFSITNAREKRLGRISEDTARETNRLNRRIADVAEANLSQNLKVSTENARIIMGYREILDSQHKHLITIYALLKGAAKGDITSEDMVKRITALVVLPEDAKPEADVDD